MFDDRGRLDVHVLPGLRFMRKIRSYERRRLQQPEHRLRDDHLCMPLYRRLRLYLGSYGLGRYCRDLSFSVSIAVHSSVRRIQLALQLPHRLLHTLHYWRYRFRLRLRLCGLQSVRSLLRLLLFAGDIRSVFGRD